MFFRHFGNGASCCLDLTPDIGDVIDGNVLYRIATVVLTFIYIVLLSLNVSWCSSVHWIRGK